MLSLTDAIVAELRSEMGGAHVTYDDLAAATGIARRTLLRHLTGETEITMTVIEQVAGGLNISMDEVFARAKMRQARPEVIVKDDGERLGPAHTPPASPRPAPLPAARRPGRRGSVGPADS